MRFAFLNFIFLLAVALPAGLSAQHDPVFSQYMFNGLVINPGYAGSQGMLSVAAINRNQWANFKGAPKTTSISLNTPLRNKKLNVGLILMNESIGLTRVNKIDGIFAYRFFFPKFSLSMGLLTGMRIFKANWDAYNTTSPGDPLYQGIEEMRRNIETGSGIYFQHSKFSFGIAAPYLFTSSEGMTGTIDLSGSYLYVISKEFAVKPSLLVKYLQGSPVQTDVNLNMYIGHGFNAGASWRSGDALYFLAEFSPAEQFTFGYGYDITLSRIRHYSDGTHEIMLRYDFGYSVDRKSTRYF
jgi:type IX secretion system PorP/SprF family membrane protein